MRRKCCAHRRPSCMSTSLTGASQWSSWIWWWCWWLYPSPDLGVVAFTTVHRRNCIPSPSQPAWYRDDDNNKNRANVWQRTDAGTTAFIPRRSSVLCHLFASRFQDHGGGGNKFPVPPDDNDNDNNNNSNNSNKITADRDSQQNPNNRNSNGSISKDYEEADFPIWVRGLSQWPLRPTSNSNSKAIRKLPSVPVNNNNNNNNNSFPLSALHEDWIEETVGTLLPNVQETMLDAGNEAILNVQTDVDENNYNSNTNNDNSNSPMGNSGFFFTSAIARYMEALVAFRSDDGKQSKSEEIRNSVEHKTNITLQQRMSSLSNEEQLHANETPSLAWNFTALEELSAWDQWVGGLKNSIGDLVQQGINRATFSRAAEGLLMQATSRIESLVDGASFVMSPKTINTLIKRASETLQNRTVANDLVDAAKQLALERGLNLSEATNRAIETFNYAANLATVADGVLRQGYVEGDVFPKQKEKQTLLEGIPQIAGSRALFAEFRSAREINTLTGPMIKSAEMGALSGAIYEDTEPRTHRLGHSIVARGVTEDVHWMVTDSLAKANMFVDRHVNMENASKTEPLLVRTITIRGFDASDEAVDRERLLTRVCTAAPEIIKGAAGNTVMVHSGLMDIARSIYEDTKQYVDWTSPAHKIVFNGHSVGGSLAELMLFLMVADRGADYVKKKVLRVFTYGAPPVVASMRRTSRDLVRRDHCSILDAFGLPAAMIYGFVQPWDPIVRLFSSIDPLYPLVGDIDADGVTIYASGPPRTLRPITKAILEAWEGWPRFRDIARSTGDQNYTSVGVQHLLLADPTRYLADRFVAVDIPVPQVVTVLRISARELLPALNAVFPLGIFELSFVPQAIRGFVHHFYPAYDYPIVDYIKLLERRMRDLPEHDKESIVNEETAVFE